VDAGPRGDIRGFTIGHLRASTGHLITIDVVARFRRGGVGRGLLSRIERGLADAGARRMLLEVARDNAGAIRFYEAAGYEPTVALPGYYGPGLDAVRMKKVLTASSPRESRSRRR